MSGSAWNGGWGLSIGNVLAEANKLKETIEKQMDEALNVENEKDSSQNQASSSSSTSGDDLGASPTLESFSDSLPLPSSTSLIPNLNDSLSLNEFESDAVLPVAAIGQVINQSSDTIPPATSEEIEAEVVEKEREDIQNRINLDEVEITQSKETIEQSQPVNDNVSATATATTAVEALTGHNEQAQSEAEVKEKNVENEENIESIKEKEVELVVSSASPSTIAISEVEKVNDAVESPNEENKEITVSKTEIPKVYESNMDAVAADVTKDEIDTSNSIVHDEVAEKLKEKVVEISSKINNGKSKREQDLLARITALEKENAEVKQNHNTIVAKAQKMHAFIENMKGKYNEMQKKLKDTEKKAAEAEEKADALLKEGMMMSKRAGDSDQTSRKLRAEKKELESKMDDLTKQKEASDSKCSMLEQELRQIRASRDKGEVSMAKISESTAELQRKLDEKERDLSIAKKKTDDAQIAHDNVLNELTENKKALAKANQQIGSLKNEIEQTQFQLREQLGTKQVQNGRTLALEKSLEDMRIALEQQVMEARSMEQLANAKLKVAEDALRASEKRAEQLAADSATLTIPLMKQIDSLQALVQRNDNSHSLLLSRAVAAEKAEAVAMEARRAAEQKRSELSVKVSELEGRVASLQSEKERLDSEVLLLKRKVEEEEKQKSQISRKLEDLKDSYEEKILKLRTTELQLRQDLLAEQEKFEKATEEYKAKQANDEAKLRDLVLAASSNNSNNNNNNTSSSLKKSSSFHSQDESMDIPSNSRKQQYQDEMMTPWTRSSSSSPRMLDSMHTTSQQQILGSLSLGRSTPQVSEIFEASSTGDDATQLDGKASVSASKDIMQFHRLKIELKQREGEILSLKELLANVTNSRDSLADEVVSLGERLKKLQEEMKEYRKMREEYVKMQGKNEVLLQLLGEKDEECEMLKSDIETIKEAYKVQIESIKSEAR